MMVTNLPISHLHLGIFGSGQQKLRIAKAKAKPSSCLPFVEWWPQTDPHPLVTFILEYLGTDIINGKDVDQ